MRPGEFLHDPSAVLPYHWDWTLWLEGATITTKVVTLPTGITRDIAHPATTETGGIVTDWLTGGVHGQRYSVVCHIATSDGRQDDRTIVLVAQNR